MEENACKWDTKSFPDYHLEVESIPNQRTVVVTCWSDHFLAPYDLDCCTASFPFLQRWQDSDTSGKTDPVNRAAVVLLL